MSCETEQSIDSELVSDVIDVAIIWWKENKPESWSVDEWMETVRGESWSWETEHEKDLTRAIAALLRHRKNTP